MYPEVTPMRSQTVGRCGPQAVADAASFVQDRFAISAGMRPVIGVILGSGLGNAGDRLQAANGDSLSYSSIPGMPHPQVSGHCGRFVFGQIHKCPVAILQGRVHYYEGHSTAAIQFGTRLLHALGVRTLIITNAAGGIRAGFQPGELMLISSHLRALAGRLSWHSNSTSPSLPVASGSADAVCFNSSAMHDLLWNEDLRHLARPIKTPLQIHEGVYAMMTGPTYETPAEILALKRLGADAVGMSTVPEALLAADLGMRVLGVSCITNVASGLSAASLNHADVTATAAAIESQFTEWLWNVISAIVGE